VVGVHRQCGRARVNLGGAQFPVLAQNGFRMIASHQRGYGRCDKPPPIWDYDTDLSADDLVDFAQGGGHLAARSADPVKSGPD
jgi:pimeloyl-ACP methyl ester carboxylesterase